MTQKRILRANARKVVRERELIVGDVFRMHAKDPDDPDVPNLINQLVEDDAETTALVFFGIAAQLVGELAEATGRAPAEILNRIPRG